jgi:hypothetical protein
VVTIFGQWSPSKDGMVDCVTNIKRLRDKKIAGEEFGATVFLKSML